MAGALRRHPVLALIVIGAALRLIFAAGIGLGVDESYMVVAGRVLSLGYFDHPPAAWWLSAGIAHLTGSEAPVIVRLPFIALFALSTWLMARLGTWYAGPRAGFYAALALNLSPVFGVTSATWVLPDGPLDCALIAAALALAHALTAPDPGRVSRAWIGAGLCAGLALFSKYSAALTLLGALAYLILAPHRRALLARPGPWVAGLLALAVFAPVVAWNAAHHWASFAFQGARAEATRLHPIAPFTVLGGEALFVLPWIWAPMMVLAGAALRRGPRDDRSFLLLCLGAPPIIAFVLIAAWTNQHVLFHWAAPGYLMLFPLLGDWLARRMAAGNGHVRRKLDAHVRRTLIGTAIFIVAAVFFVIGAVRTDALHPVLVAAGARHDPVLEGIDWVSLRRELAARGLLDRPNTVFAAPSWRDGGKLGIALGPRHTLLCLNRDARQFAIAAPPGREYGKDVLILVPGAPSGLAPDVSRAFASVSRLAPLSVRHGGRDLLAVGVFLGHDLRRWPAH